MELPLGTASACLSSLPSSSLPHDRRTLQEIQCGRGKASETESPVQTTLSRSSPCQFFSPETCPCKITRCCCPKVSPQAVQFHQAVKCAPKLLPSMNRSTDLFVTRIAGIVSSSAPCFFSLIRVPSQWGRSRFLWLLSFHASSHAGRGQGFSNRLSIQIQMNLQNHLPISSLFSKAQKHTRFQEKATGISSALPN